jgi:hypothetical protein
MSGLMRETVCRILPNGAIHHRVCLGCGGMLVLVERVTGEGRDPMTIRQISRPFIVGIDDVLLPEQAVTLENCQHVNLGRTQPIDDAIRAQE